MYGQWVGDVMDSLDTYASVRETQGICNPPPPENVILIEITSNQPQGDNSKEQVEAAIDALKKLGFDK